MRPAILPPLLAVWFLILSGRLARGLTVAALGPGAGSELMSLAVVDGRPAVAWVATGANTVNYVRALDADGAAWGTPVTVIQAGITGSLTPRLTLRVVNGHPAICFASSTGVRYIRAQDQAGTAWPSLPFAVSEGTGMATVMKVINGKPAVLVRLADIARYSRATDANGYVWAPPALVPAVLPSSLDLEEVDGRPAMIYISGRESLALKFLRALDADGMAWGAPVDLPIEAVMGPCALQMVEGRPAAACFTFTQTSTSFNYFRALDADGSAWGPPVTVHSSPLPSGLAQMGQLSLSVVNGAPAMAVVTPVSQLFFARAANPSGSVWNEAGSLDTGGSLSGVSLAEVNGRPAVAYGNLALSMLQYLRAGAGPDGTGAQWPPELSVRLNDSVVRSGSAVTFNNTAAGSMNTVTLILRNPGLSAADLHFTGLTLTGTNVSEFEVLTPPQSPVPGGGTTHAVVAYAPLTSGLKNAELQISSDTATGVSPFVLKLSGRTQPDISVERPGGMAVPPLSVLGLPPVAAGGQANFVFIVRNSGVADLNSLNAVLNGGNPEFSIVQPLPASLPPGAAAALVIRHAPVSAGPKSATIIISSSAPAPLHQFVFTLRLQPGSVDDAFAPAADEYFSVALEPGGRILAGGNGTVAAFLADGSPDTTFFAPVINGGVLCLAVQRNGGIIAGGTFSQAGGFERRHLVRLLPDGSVDPFFDAQVWGPVNALAVLPNDKILAGGALSTRPVPVPPSLVRLLPDGTADNTFQCSLTDTVTDVDLQADGRALVCSISSGSTPARLFNESGSDASLSFQFSGRMRVAARRPDGVLAGALMDGGVVRLNAAGQPAPGLVPVLGSGTIANLLLQADGACLVTGETIGGALLQPAMGRVLADGGSDTGFLVRADRGIWSVALQEDGKPVIAGSFRMVNDESVLRQGLVRLNNEPSVSILSREGNTAVRWMRGGTAPEVSDVSFEINTTGGNSGNDPWTLLGFGTRIPGGWELTGLNLPETCRLRARARAGGSLTQVMVSYPPPLEAWRLAHFGTADNTGDAANDADPDKDGLTNFVEFAFDLNPMNAGSSTLPAFTLTGGGLTAVFTAPEGRDAIVRYRAAWSASLAAGTWTPMPDLGMAPNHVFQAPAVGKRVFVRWEVDLR
ncbi:MAG TPA: choice-of-anchor D domain-containing protein [Verrucomicrobiales bacterium]|nr:choice-of-anchor D domain-containing protein [Verrucomicrobiales bacterium]